MKTSLSSDMLSSNAAIVWNGREDVEKTPFHPHHSHRDHWMCNSTCFIRCGFGYCQLSSVWLRGTLPGEERAFSLLSCTYQRLPIGKRWACKELGWLRARRRGVHSHGCLWMLRMPRKRPLFQLQLPLSGGVVFVFFTFPPCHTVLLWRSQNVLHIQPNQRLC